jgi:hypothetical protein
MDYDWTGVRTRRLMYLKLMTIFLLGGVLPAAALVYWLQLIPWI